MDLESTCRVASRGLECALLPSKFLLVRRFQITRLVLDRQTLVKAGRSGGQFLKSIWKEQAGSLLGMWSAKHLRFILCIPVNNLNSSRRTGRLRSESVRFSKETALESYSRPSEGRPAIPRNLILSHVHTFSETVLTSEGEWKGLKSALTSCTSCPFWFCKLSKGSFH
jgi:hypothetical protein